MKLKGLIVEIVTDRETIFSIVLDADGEVTKVDLSAGEFWPEDLESGAALVRKLWDAVNTSNGP